ncbi:hypothetical protein NEMBOFW57_009773 [Staphylotrichum longicolle]|uniref:Pentatricopeptide repeat domain-containing protein n=1 Tax=Staphylotrichum longicolle TaxID=669026 RepID=A0AAD4HV10_9PEZI|nr:hypothetical protein NEMBOFW57_009773 [Staphylotrichum longicolle]
MATAAVLDAGRKDRRRRDLDHQIAEAKNSLATTLDQSNARDLAKVVTSAYPEVPSSRTLEILDFLDDLFKLEPDFLRDLAQKRQNRLTAVQRTRKMLGLHWNPELPKTRQPTFAKCQAVFSAEEKGLELPVREAKAEIHMEKVSDMISSLVDRLMEEAWLISEIEAPGSHPAMNSPDSANTMIRMLRSDGYPTYEHPDVDLESTIEQRARLNDVNMKILGEWARPMRERCVAKICYNMLVCGVSPGIQNYNLLILAFSLLGEHNLAQAVVDSFLFKSHMKTDRSNISLLTTHYRLKGDVVGFHGLVRRMFGNDPRGIGLMRRHSGYVALRSELHDWATSPNVALVKGYYVQRAPFTQNVAEALLEGLVDFGMLREGAKLLAVCLQEKWAISRDLLWRLFHSCLTVVDTGAVKLIVRGLLDNIEEASAMILGPEPSSEEALRSEKARLNHLVTAIWIREAWHYSNNMTWWLRKIEKNLSRHDVPLSDRLDKALSIFDSAAGHAVQKLHKAERFQRAAKLDWLASQLAVSDYRIRNAENAICNVLARQTPRQLRMKEQFHASVPIEKRIERARAYNTPGTPEYAAALCFDLSKEIDSQLKRALFKALPPTLQRELRETPNNSGDVSITRTLACFEHYLASLTTKLVGEAKEAGTTKSGRFARLLEMLARPRFAFWKSRYAAEVDEAPPPGREATADPFAHVRDSTARPHAVQYGRVGW